jgi:hypothetical protein
MLLLLLLLLLLLPPRAGRVRRPRKQRCSQLAE